GLHRSAAGIPADAVRPARRSGRGRAASRSGRRRAGQASPHDPDRRVAVPRLSLRERLLTALLRLFPAEFRGDFGDQIRDDFHDQEIDARTRSRKAVARLWMRTTWDFVRRGPREHADVIVRDARFGARLLMRSPGLAASTLVTLAV